MHEVLYGIDAHRDVRSDVDIGVVVDERHVKGPTPERQRSIKRLSDRLPLEAILGHCERQVIKEGLSKLGKAQLHHGLTTVVGICTVRPLRASGAFLPTSVAPSVSIAASLAS